MIEWVIVRGYRETTGKNSPDVWTESCYQVFRRITENANAAMLNFHSPVYPELAVRYCASQINVRCNDLQIFWNGSHARSQQRGMVSPKLSDHNSKQRTRNSSFLKFFDKKLWKPVQRDPVEQPGPKIRARLSSSLHTFLQCKIFALPVVYLCIIFVCMHSIFGLPG